MGWGFPTDASSDAVMLQKIPALAKVSRQVPFPPVSAIGNWNYQLTNGLKCDGYEFT
jgi:hypothetical protein